MEKADVKIPIGKLLRADAGSFVGGCRVQELVTPSLGALVKVPLADGIEVYGLISNISIADDGMVRQIASRVSLPVEYERDNRYNRNLPVEISVLTVGFKRGEKILQHFPPRPPLSLDALWLCDDNEVVRFTKELGYLRHILRLQDQPIEELLVTHLMQAKAAHESQGHAEWYPMACRELIALLRDDYLTLSHVLLALGELEQA